jgi:hypothetical protein
MVLFSARNCLGPQRELNLRPIVAAAGQPLDEGPSGLPGQERDSSHDPADRQLFTHCIKKRLQAAK